MHDIFTWKCSNKQSFLFCFIFNMSALRLLNFYCYSLCINTKRGNMKQINKVAISVIATSVFVLAGCHQINDSYKSSISNESHARNAESASLVSQNAQKDLKSAVANIHFTGTAAIVRNGHIIAHVSSGYSNIDKISRNDLNTEFEEDSIQKSMTAVLLMRQIQGGKLRLNTLLSTYYPNVPGANRITIRQLLDMTSGLSIKRFRAPHFVNDQLLVQDFIKHTSFSSTLWNRWNYQPINYVLIVGILEKVTGITYEQLFRQTFIQDMNLRHTHFAYESKVPNRAQGYAWNKDLQQADFSKALKTTTDMEHYELGTGQIFITVKDLYRVQSAIVSGQLLGKPATNVLHWPGSESTYAGGYYHHHGYSGAQGYGYGYEGFLRISPNGRNAVIFLANSEPNKPTFLIAANRLALHYAH